MKRSILVLLISISLSVLGQTNYVMDFDGTSASVDVGTTVGNGVRSIEFWFKPSLTINSSTSLGGCAMIIRNDNSQLHEYGVYIRGNEWFSNVGNLVFYVRDNGVDHEVFSNSTTWTAGTWYHVAGVVDAVSGMKLYINGVLQSNTDPNCTTATQTDNSTTNLGVWGDAAVRYFPGRIEEMRLWSRAISQSEIQTKMCQDLVPANETGLQAYWKFNEGSGSQILDATSNNNDGTISGTTWVADNPCSVPSNYVMNFNGVSGSVDVGTTVGNGVRSIEFWFKPSVTINSGTSLGGCAMIIRNDNSQLHEYGVYIRGNEWFSNVGNLVFYVRDNGVDHEVFSNSTTWTAGTWYHVAGVVDPVSGMKLYINGVLQSNTDPNCTTATQTDNSTSNLGVWGNAGVRYFPGRLEEMRLWSRAISQNEIQTKMCQNLTPANETGLQAYWKFNEGSGTQILDATANSNNGTINNTTWVAEAVCSNEIKTITHRENEVQVYPNPANGIINIKLENNYEDVNYHLIDAMGREVLSGKLSGMESQLDLSRLDDGVYLISFAWNMQTTCKKIIVQK